MLEKNIIHHAKEMEDGDSAKVKRLFPVPGFKNYDPFVLLDEFAVDPKSGFPTHPHRGFEAITYMLDGSFRHQDNLGNDTTVYSGGAQRFTAGNGMFHSEMPASNKIAHGFQLWINLPKRLKEIEPEYQQVDSQDIPEYQGDGYFIRTLVGEKSPITIKTPVHYQDIQLSKGKDYTIKAESGFNSFIYLFMGELSHDDGLLDIGTALFFQSSDRVNLRAIEDSRFIYLSGQPHKEPIKQWGPYVD